jgi:hypothetical protein
MRSIVGEVRRDVTARPSILVDVMSIPPPARAGRGAATHSRSTTSETGRSGLKTICSVPVTVPPENDTVAETRGRFGSGSAYDVGHALAAVVGVGLAAPAVTVTLVVLSVVARTREGCGVGATGVGAALVGVVLEPAQAVASATTAHHVLIARR